MDGFENILILIFLIVSKHIKTGDVVTEISANDRGTMI